MIQKTHFKDMPLLIAGGGRIDESSPIDLRDYVGEDQNAKIIGFAPGKLCFSEEIGKTVYDVTGCFDLAGRQSLLQQFKSLILNPHN